MIDTKKFILIFISLFLIMCSPKTYALENKEILFISSYNPNFITFKDQVKGIESALGDDYNLQVQYMNSTSDNYRVDENNFYNLLKYSLSTYKHLEGIILGDDDALEFYIKYRDDLFKDIPVSFFGIINEENINKVIKFDNVVGVREKESLDEIIKLIQNYHKNVENIILIDNDYRVINSFYDNKGHLKYNDFNFENLVTKEFNIDDFKNEISNINKNSAIISLYPIHFKDVQWLDYNDINPIIKDNTNNIPIYTCLTYGITDGVIGGKVVDMYNHSKVATEMLLKFINGENLNNKYIGDDSTNDYVFNYNSLKKHNIKLSSLPENSTIINNPIDTIKRNKYLFLCILLLLLTLMSIIITLIIYIKYRIKYERNIIKAKNMAEEASMLKSHFISNISHELKTPIIVIMSVIQLLQIKNTNHYSDKNIDIIDKNCKRLLRLINNIIDMEKFDAKEIKLDLKNINIVNLIDDIVDSVEPYAKSKNLNMIFDPYCEEVYMAIDGPKIERVILNLLSNAIKFSYPSGTVYINLYKDNENNVVISFKDSGPGISEKNLKSIFDRFTQVDNTMRRNNEGSGIGLSIANSFVTLHKGTIDVKSKENEGSEFIVKIPIKLIDEENILFYDREILDNNAKTELSDIYL